jgi:cell division protein FtsW (lipid II flippase)
MIGEVITLFFVMLAVTTACFLGMFAAEGIVSKFMPSAVSAMPLVWMAIKMKATQIRERISTLWNSATSGISSGYQKTKSKLATVIPFRNHNTADATS